MAILVPPSVARGGTSCGVSRCCRVRRVDQFDPDQAADRLLAGQDVQGDFTLVESALPPSSESCFAVCTDGQYLHVSVLLWEAGGFGASPPAAQEKHGAGQNVVELLIGPWGDGVGFLHLISGPGQECSFTAHWPYRDGRVDLAERIQFEVQWQVRTWSDTEVARIAWFRLPLKGVVGAGYAGPLAFNVMRTQLRCEENSTWSHVSSFFGDPQCTGWLDLSAGVEVQAGRVSPMTFGAGKPRSVQLQATYDFPDEFINAPYTPEMVRREMQVLRQAGVRRIYWLDYPFMARGLALAGAAEAQRYSPFDDRRLECIRRSLAAFDGDPLGPCVRIAHDLGLEFFPIFKPFDVFPSWTAPRSATALIEAVCQLDGRHLSADPFVAEHLAQAFRRNPAWHGAERGPVTELVLWSDNDRPLDFDIASLQVLASDDNEHFIACHRVVAEQGVAPRPRYRWTPAGKQPTEGNEQVRFIRLRGLAIQTCYFAVQIPGAAGPGASATPDVYPHDFGNQRYLLAEAFSGKRMMKVTVAWPHRNSFGGYEFNRATNGPEWCCVSEAVQRRLSLTPGAAIGLAVGEDEHLFAMLEPAFESVHRHWLDQYVKRALAAGADGLDVRIAHHNACSDWLSYAWAQPVLEVFRDRFGRDPRPEAHDYEQARRIRGQFYTSFLRAAKSLLAAAGLKLEHHVEARMMIGPAYDTYTQIHWDYATWIDEGIIDGVNLKYLGPCHPWVHREILPRARRRGIPVHAITALSDPRSHPRAAEAHRHYVELARRAGLDGVNLYEVWVYLRGTAEGHLIERGNTRSIFRDLARLGRPG